MKKNLYSEEEISKIFFEINSETDLVNTCTAFHWLINTGFIDNLPIIYSCANEAFRRIFKIDTL